MAKAELMAALSDATRARLAKQGVPCTVEPGKLLFAKGDKGDAGTPGTPGLRTQMQVVAVVRAGDQLGFRLF